MTEIKQTNKQDVFVYPIFMYGIFLEHLICIWLKYTFSDLLEIGSNLVNGWRL